MKITPVPEPQTGSLQEYTPHVTGLQRKQGLEAQNFQTNSNFFPDQI